ncbi:MAG: hypothetical protein QME76_09275 [Bacillota bacterium]|nr:hypothetical protein [Bacillota bacterium]
MNVVWKWQGARAYAYLNHCQYDRGRKGPRTETTYLGCRLDEAERKLGRILASGRILVSGREAQRLIEELRKKAPEAARRPRPDRAKESVKRNLERLRERYKARPDLTAALDAALDKLKEG